MLATATIKDALVVEVEAEVEAEVGGEEATIHRHRILRPTTQVLRQRRTLQQTALKAGDRASGLVPLEELPPDTWLEEWQETTETQPTRMEAETAGMVEIALALGRQELIQGEDRIRLPVILLRGTRVRVLGLPAGDELSDQMRHFMKKRTLENLQGEADDYAHDSSSHTYMYM